MSILHGSSFRCEQQFRYTSPVKSEKETFIVVSIYKTGYPFWCNSDSSICGAPASNPCVETAVHVRSYAYGSSNSWKRELGKYVKRQVWVSKPPSRLASGVRCFNPDHNIKYRDCNFPRFPQVPLSRCGDKKRGEEISTNRSHYGACARIWHLRFENVKSDVISSLVSWGIPAQPRKPK